MEAKEPYYGGKRDLLWRQKRPTMEAKETYYGGKRDLLWRQKRPTKDKQSVNAHDEPMLHAQQDWHKTIHVANVLLMCC
jgi:hypothetical protein